MTTIQTLRKFLAEDLSANVAELGDEDSLLESGILDSMAIMKLITFLDEQFNVELTDEEFDPENFESLAAIDRLVEQKRGG